MNRISQAIDRTLSAINTAIKQNFARVPAWSKVQTITCPAAGDQVIVFHPLGEVPDRFSAVPWDDAGIWVSSDDRKQWTKETIAFHCSAETRVDVSVGRL